MQGNADPLIGTKVGNYTLVARLGAGGMGDVYKGINPLIDAKVAIKLLNAGTCNDPASVIRFLREAKAVNRIEHDGVIKVVDAGRAGDGRPYLVMPLLEGESLHERLQRGPMSVDEACAIAIEVLDAVDAAHACDIVHRDMKPANIFITYSGRIVLLDFGIAKMMAETAANRLTITGSAVGTPHYMAPEQVVARGVGPSADVYSVGIVLYEMLCSRRPFEGDSPFDVMACQLERRPPPPRALRPDVPIAVQDVILTAMAKTPEYRFLSAAAMRDALRAALAPPTQRLPTFVPPPPHRWRRFALAGVACAAALALAAWIHTSSASAQRPSSTSSPSPSPSPAVAAITPAPPAIVVTPIAILPEHAPPPVEAPPVKKAKASSRRDPRRSASDAGSETPTLKSPPDSTAPGRVTIESDPPGAVIEVDGELAGTTPWTGELPGRQRVTFVVSRPGYRIIRRAVVVVPDEHVVLKPTLVALEPRTANRTANRTSERDDRTDGVHMPPEFAATD